MTKKHFKRLAEALAKHRPLICSDPVAANAFRTLVYDIAFVCKDTNPNFDTQRFLDACKLDEHAEETNK